jgi:hypothetical protein
LDWSEWILLVPDTAQDTNDGKQIYPSDKRKATTDDPTASGMLTYIEYPYALYLAPTVYKGSGTGYATNFKGRTAPLKSSRDFYDPWTAAVSQTKADGSSQITQGTAIWARDLTRDKSLTLEQYLDFNDPGHPNP